ncbi:MAG: HAD family hydrolase [Proteobacteria bacterium]|nr:HAD family hydrolase [Pseudomonadota bacterium]MDA1023581.1 HAD family hydrolase [Pseudomonadota bacterium]
MTASPQLGKPKAILFDWDNTLVDTWPTILDALNTTFTAYKLPHWTMQEARVRVRKSLRDSFPELFGDKWEQAGDVFYRRYREIHVEKLEPLKGAGEMLQSLSGAGIHLAVISNKKGEFLRLESGHLGWDGFFATLIGATDAKKDKPATEPVDMALSRIGIERGPDVWFAGDADIDLECAHNAGLTPVLVRTEAPTEEEMADHPPLHHFQGCEALCKFVNCM